MRSEALPLRTSWHGFRRRNDKDMRKTQPKTKKSGAPKKPARNTSLRVPPVLSLLFGDLFPQANTVPAAIMMPRLVLIGSSCFLLALGLVMVYSASMIKGLLQDGQDPQSFLVKQLILTFIGFIVLIIALRANYKRLANQFLGVIWVLNLLLLLIVAFFGTSSHGAARWIPIGSFTFQPSELAKIVVVLTAANLLSRQEGAYNFDPRRFWAQFGENRQFWLFFIGAVVVPTFLIFIQPDKGTTFVLGATILVMMWMAGLPPKLIALLAGVALVLFFGLSLRDEYSRKRLLTMFDPFEDPAGDGYQLIQGFYAFGSGGLFGLGLGLGRQKYSYLPEAHNDFIFPVIGEELGLLWCLGVLLAFAALVWAGIKIAQYAPDKTGQLVALGCTLLIAVQTLLNISGVLGIFPLTGKAVPFLSYGGSSIVSTLAIIGILLSVSVADELPSDKERARRSRLQLVGEADSYVQKRAGELTSNGRGYGRVNEQRKADRQSRPSRRGHTSPQTENITRRNRGSTNLERARRNRSNIRTTK